MKFSLLRQIRCERALPGMVALALSLALVSWAASMRPRFRCLRPVSMDQAMRCRPARLIRITRWFPATIQISRFPMAHVVGTPPAGWVANTASSTWIAPDAIQTGDVDVKGNGAGTYIYEITFNLGPAPSQESIVGDWAVNTIGLILLNGQYVNNTTNLSGPTSLTSFSIPSTANFVTGENKLDFVVVNATAGSTGLYIGDIRGSYTPGIPEPSSVVLAGMGVAGLLVYRLRRRRSK